MSEAVKITTSHLARVAIVYLRQSSAAQVAHNRESTDRQYALVNKAGDLGWPADKVIVIDEDLGVSGSGAVARSRAFKLVGIRSRLSMFRAHGTRMSWWRMWYGG